MPRCPGPDEPGYNHDVFFGYLIGVALRTARRTGFGLPLVNEMLTDLPDVPREMIGQAASTANAGFQAAQDFQNAGPDALPNLDALPTVPSSFAADHPGRRIVGLSDAAFKDDEGNTLKEWTTFWGSDENERMQTIVNQQEEQLDEELEETDPLLKELKSIIGINMIFMGKRF